MRQVRYSVAVSLDGYIAGPAGEFDWIPNEPEIDWRAFMGRFDTVLMGRHTYEATLSQGEHGSKGGMRTYVFSRTLRGGDHPAVTVVQDRAADVVAELRREQGKEIWLMGGGVLFQSLLDAGVVDAVEAAIVPILLGAGMPFLAAPAQRTRLKLTDLKRYATSGIVLLNYDAVLEAA